MHFTFSSFHHSRESNKIVAKEPYHGKETRLSCFYMVANYEPSNIDGCCRSRGNSNNDLKILCNRNINKMT